MTDWLDDTEDDPTYRRLLAQEKLILDVTCALHLAMTDAGVTQAELARRLGKSDAFVSKVFSGKQNMTLRTVADVAAALGIDVVFALEARANNLRTKEH